MRRLAALGVLLAAPPAWALVPYRSTDAETAEPWHLETRVGLARLEHDRGEDEWTSPLLRLNFGLPGNVEILTELELLPAEGRFADGAAGAKWIPYFHAWSFGIEVLALLPVTGEGGAGVESSLLATGRFGDFRIHFNAAGFYDARPEPEELGWKGGSFAELQLGSVRPGLEIHLKRVADDPVQVLAGVACIVDLSIFDVRAAVHVGLTPEAPDVIASLWVTRAFDFASHGEGAEG